MNRRRSFTAAVLGGLLASLPAPASMETPPAPQTPSEIAGRPSTPGEAREFLRGLAAAPGMEYRELPAGGGPGGGPLPLVVWPASDSGPKAELTVLLMAGQHGDEPSGSDALVALVRDLASGRYSRWWGRLRLLILPQMNPWGIEAGVRNNESNLDLNRDHLRLKAPQTLALHRLFAEWAPQVTIDLHEKPETCRHVEWARATHPSEGPRLRAVGRLIMKGAAKALLARDIPSHPFFTRSFAVVPGSSPPRMSVFYHPALPDPSDGMNSFALQGSESFFVETASGPPEGAYGDIVAVHLEALTALIEAALDRAGPLREATERFRASPPAGGVALQMRQAASPEEPAGEFTRCGEAADLRSGIRPWMPRVDVTLHRSRPAAYWIPARFAVAAEILAGHGIRLYTAVRELDAEGEPGRIVRAAPPAPEYASPPMSEAEFSPRRVRIPAGDWVVPVDSPYWDLLPILLEPESQFGLGRYADLGLSPRKGEAYPVVRLAALPPAEALAPWHEEAPEEEPAGGTGRRPEGVR